MSVKYPYKSSHYSCGLNPSYMKAWASKKAAQIKKLISTKTNKEYLPVLLYSGMSGINHATYLASALTDLSVNFGQVYVRKKNEKISRKIM